MCGVHPTEKATADEIKAVLFDMDGTVFDTERIYWDCWLTAAEAVGFGEMEALLAKIFGTSERDIGKYVYQTYGADFPYEKMLALRAEMIAQRIAREGVPLKDGVPEVFEQLKARGIQSALVTSAPTFRIRDFLSRSHLEHAFSAVISGDRVPMSKPAPDIYLLAARELGLDPKHCLAVEDSCNGVLSAHRAGMRVALVPDLQQPTPEILSLVSHLLPSLRLLPEVI